MYQDYIDQLKLTKETAYGQCENHAREMQKKFPELKLIAGYYWCALWGKREHWWLETKIGEVIDPTAIQFPSEGIGFYDEAKGVPPTGKCPHCGEYIYDGGYTHEGCHEAFVSSLFRGGL